MGRCKQCNQPLVEIDNYGERLIRCIECNHWRASKQPIELPEEDIQALRALVNNGRQVRSR
jgi:DNA-directed RNA polymerase subunit RPC12/RpoP